MTDFGKIEKLLTTKFEKELFESSIENLKDHNNKLRYNNFAYSIRELSRHILYSLSPESDVKNCSWYKPETADHKATRTQRIKYAIQGGITDKLLIKLGFDLSQLTTKIKLIKGTIDTLSKFTHINPDVFNLKSEVVDINSLEVLSTFKVFVETIENYRYELKHFLDGHVQIHMISSMVYSNFDNIDRLAPHYSLTYVDISNYHIDEITYDEIIVKVSGYLNVTLEYGSRKERREGDGLDLKESFPFETKIRYEIGQKFPSNNYKIDDYDVDTSEWYGDDEHKIDQQN